MKQFRWKIGVCLALILISGWVVAQAAVRYSRGEGGFKLGVDLVGGTILVYEVDIDRLQQEAAATGGDPLARLDSAKMVEYLKRRIDPAGIYDITIRPIGKTRVEIILPSGGEHQAIVEEAAWKELLVKVQENPDWKDALGDVDLDVGRGHERELAVAVHQGLEKSAWTALIDKLPAKYPALKDNKEVKLDAIAPGQILALIDAVKGPAKATPEDLKKYIDENFQPIKESDVTKFIKDNYAFGKAQQKFSGEGVQRIKDLIGQQGSLEFRIVANQTDDKRALDIAKADIADPANKTDLEERAKRGLPPPAPKPRENEEQFRVANSTSDVTYSWVEIGKSQRASLGLSNAAGATPAPGSLWGQVAQAREKGEPYLQRDDSSERGGSSSMLIYSRKCENLRLTPEERTKKAYEYFALVRDPELDPETGKPLAVTGDFLISAQPDDSSLTETGVQFTFNSEGGRRFYNVTWKNRPSRPEGSTEAIQMTYRQLAIILDGQIVSAPTLNEAIRDRGRITGKFTPEQVNQLVTILRSGALPATLKSMPVSETTIGPTLGADTIDKGTKSIAWAFAAVLVFMVIYYRFAGLVACVALFMNLLLTIAFMVFVNATFTLPGLAGLVLTLGMAVDANILIYERLREERERGASLTLALRNGYDRAFPTIIDTHLTSFFTAVVLYTVGNDQLRGFGISLAAGLVISLYTSLIVTRMLFDVWQYKGWLKKLSMLKMLTKTNIGFMRIRHYWFTATILLTVIGLGIFLLRGEQGLNIDFVGGTAYGGQLKLEIRDAADNVVQKNEARTIGELRELLGHKNQKKQLAVTDVEERDIDGKSFLIVYGDGAKQTIAFAESAPGANDAERKQNVKDRASVLPDWSVEQTIVSKEADKNPPGASRYFTIRTTEKEADLVQVSVDRLLRDPDTNASLLQRTTITDIKPGGDGKATLTFSDFASPGYLKLLLEREFRAKLPGQSFDLRGVGKSEESRFKTMLVEVTTQAFDKEKYAGKFAEVLATTKDAFAARPQPERLEKFDAQLAAETSARAAYAILASWAVILLFLWFRFGNWTFGMAAVFCLVHDLCFTLGMIALCHYLVATAPWLASALLIDDFKIDLPAIAALLTLIGYSVNDTIVVFDRIREVRGKNPQLTAQMIDDGINQALSRTILASTTVFLVVIFLYLFGGESIRLFAFVMVVGVIVGTYSSIYIASPLLLIFGEGTRKSPRERPAVAEPVRV